MEPSEAGGRRAGPAEALALQCRLLSVGFSAPGGDVLDELRLLAAPARALADEDVASALGDLELALAAGELLPALEEEYERLFGGAVRVPPYEGSYEADPVRQGRQLADVEGFYRAFGAQSGGPAAERGDHVGCELEFLAFLLARRAQAEAAGDRDHAEVCRRAEDAFLEDHLGRWLPEFFGEVARTTASPVYGLLAAAGERMLASETVRRGLSPAPLPRRRRSAVEGDELVCGGGIEAAIAGRDERVR